MLMQKWNYEKKVYEEYIVPVEWHTPLYSADMNEVVNCAQCGEEMKFGDGYTSQEIHTQRGFGYSVCPSCHEKELKRRYGK